MAFTFNAINSALDGNENGKLDMFSEQKPQKANPQFGGSSNGPVQLSSTGKSSISAAPHAGSSPAASPTGNRPSPTYNPGFAQKAFSGISTADSAPHRASIGGSIASANDKLQAEANAYTAKANDTAKGYTLDSGTLEKAAQGDDAAFQAAQARLAKTQADPFEQFKGLKDEDLPSAADNLKRKETFGEIYRPKASANFGSGESRFQSLLLHLDPTMRSEARTLVGNQQRVIEDNDKAVVDKTKEANETLSKAYAGATAKARAELEAMGGAVKTAAADRAVQQSAARAGLDPRALSQQELLKLAEKLRKDHKGTGTTIDRALSYLDNPEAFDLSKYLTVDKDVSADEVMTKEEVDRFNRIHGLLGSGELATLSATGAGPEYTFNSSEAEQDIRTQLESRRQAEDRELQSKFDAIVKGAGDRGAADQGDPLQNAKDYVKRRYLLQNEGQSDYDRRAEEQAYNQLFRPETNWVPYFTQKGAITPNAGPRTWDQMLTSQEAAELTELSQAMGLGDTYQAGSSYNQTNYDPTYFNEQFEKTFARILSELDGQRRPNALSRDSYDKILNRDT